MIKMLFYRLLLLFHRHKMVTKAFHNNNVTTLVNTCSTCGKETILHFDCAEAINHKQMTKDINDHVHSFMAGNAEITVKISCNDGLWRAPVIKGETGTGTVDADNHLMDAARYCLLSRFSKSFFGL
jgi:hypothetical protein